MYLQIYIVLNCLFQKNISEESNISIFTYIYKNNTKILILIHINQS